MGANEDRGEGEGEVGVGVGVAEGGGETETSSVVSSDTHTHSDTRTHSFATSSQGEAMGGSGGQEGGRGSGGEGGEREKLVVVKSEREKERERDRERERVRAEVLAQGMYKWFRVAFESRANSATNSPAIAFQRFLLRTTPFKGLGSGTLTPDDLRALMLGVARQMGVMPHMPGPRLSYMFKGDMPLVPLEIDGELRWEKAPVGKLLGTVPLPLTAPSPKSRYPTSAEHVNCRVLLSAKYLTATGWELIHLTPPPQKQARLPTLEEMAVLDGAGGVRSVWEWLPRAFVR